ncbi:DUF3772 domain-containing protein [Oxalicibacterium faecigallinarum]|uniref:Membrane protein n=1 Tax=Oxalicibacterium faecigallinarum TaxID=573741 RepID=A0A8J3F0V3_9BURK|nr:DUF3772 domain-containing protein [Oxalicibacterium faecigallinarum]GGI15916.1 membrane protein [Oxalicibacterium faecigallinarum]
MHPSAYFSQTSIFGHTLKRWLTFVSFALLAFFSAAHPGWTQDNIAGSVDQQLDSLRQQITSIQTALKNEAALDDATLSKMKADALGAGAEADRIARDIDPQLIAVQARLAELGKPSQDTKEAKDVAAQREQLEKDSSAFDSQVKLARLLSVEADQASEQVSTVRRTQLQARLGERTTSILSKPFWTQLVSELPQNLQRVQALLDSINQSARNTSTQVWLAIAVGIIIVTLARIQLGNALLAFTSTRVPHGRLRRSVYALVLTLLAVATPFLITELLKMGLRWDDGLSEKAMNFLGSLIGIICFSGFIAGIGYALLSPGRPSWRLLPLHDRLAHRMRKFPLVFALVVALCWIAELVTTAINAGLTTAVAINCIVALMLGATMALGIQRAERMWRHIKNSEPDQAHVTPIWLRMTTVLIWVALSISTISLLTGYVALGSFVIKQIAWIAVVVCSTYLLMVLVDDTCMLLSSTAPDPDAKHTVLPTPQARDQAAVLLSGAARAIVLLLATMLLLAPFGEGPNELIHRIGQLNDGLSIGEVQIKPSAITQAVLVLVLGFIGLRLLKQWLEKRYLPTTSLDTGMQVSASTLFGYAGGIIAVALAMSAAGIGLERIAWVASALSVGIGFGLQAVVQNFVSGLILLAERPVKVGDWVSLGGVEGDIRRINVRATEIQMGDRSTVIVPNSEFITKTVRNVTHASPLGLVQIKLPLPFDIDAEHARALIMDAFTSNPDILDTPAPNVQLDGIDKGYLVFNATGFASSPRLTYGIRSNLLFDVLRRLREADIPLERINTMLLGTNSNEHAEEK